MKDRSILDNARNMLLITAGSFCLSAAAAALPTQNRLGQEQNQQSACGKRCAEKSDSLEDEQRQRSAKLSLGLTSAANTATQA